MTGVDELATELASAFHEGRLRIAVQPIVSLPEGALVGVEVLLRWPDGPGPDVFVPVAEASGLIIPVGRWVLSQAVDVGAELSRRLGRTVPVSVNVSARQLADTTFVAHVAHELDRSGLPGSALSLELTETAVVDDVERAAAVLHALRALGCGIGLDDFGTGWSTLSLVAVLPLTFLKLDRSFVSALEGEIGSKVARAVIGLGRDLDLSVVAEGVETRAQAATLQGMGCRLAQGYLFARPTLQLDDVVSPLRTVS